MTLYEITGRYRDLMWLAEDPEADPETVQTCMEELDDDLATKADGYVTVIKSLEGDNETDKKEIKRLQARVNARERNIKAMKNNLLDAMDAAALEKLPTEHYRLSKAKNGGVAPLIITGTVPPDYCRLEPDDAEIRAAIKQGKVLDFAYLGDRGTHLAIR